MHCREATLAILLLTVGWKWNFPMNRSVIHTCRIFLRRRRKRIILSAATTRRQGARTPYLVENTAFLCQNFGQTTSKWPQATPNPWRSEIPADPVGRKIRNPPGGYPPDIHRISFVHRISTGYQAEGWGSPPVFDQWAFELRESQILPNNKDCLHFF